MRYSTINSNLFKKNRARLIEKMAVNSVAIFHSNDLMPKNADQVMSFVQNSDLFYLSGIDQEETVLVIIKLSGQAREMLFIRETSDLIKVWEGKKLTIDQASSVSGVDEVFWNKSFKHELNAIVSNISNIYLNSNDHPRANIVVESRDARFKKWIQNKFPNKNYKKVTHLLYSMRSIKELEEIDLIKKACDITHLGVQRVFRFLKPGVYEYEIEAEIIHEFLINRASGFAYDPIIATGSNACILHYSENNMRCEKGDLVLMDFGAEYANYSSDLTRCFPVSGRFSKRQKDVYNAVLRVMKSATKILQPGLMLSNYEKMVGELMEKELVDLGLLSIAELKEGWQDGPAYKKYFMHGTSHHLGLDVHDVSAHHEPIAENMVFTCEPGIYIPEEGLGIRLENDIVIRDGDNIDLMGHIPIEIEEVENGLNI